MKVEIANVDDFNEILEFKSELIKVRQRFTMIILLNR